MKLSILERLMIMNILPKESNFLTLKIIRELQTNLSFSEEEISFYKMETLENGNIKWDDKKEQEKPEKEIEIGGKTMSIIVESLEKLDKANKITLSHFSLCEKFLDK